MCLFCNINDKIKIYLSFLLIFFLFSCSKSEVDPVTGKSRDIEPNVDKRARDAADSNSIFTFGGKKNESTTFSFATSNPLWRATLKSLDFLPLANADYQGGIIVYDWYSDNQRFNEQVIQKLLQYPWWELDDRKINILAPFLLQENFDLFFEKLILLKKQVLSPSR